jgi:hypothetical protein
MLSSQGGHMHYIGCTPKKPSIQDTFKAMDACNDMETSQQRQSCVKGARDAHLSRVSPLMARDPSYRTGAVIATEIATHHSCSRLLPNSVVVLVPGMEVVSSKYVITPKRYVVTPNVVTSAVNLTEITGTHFYDSL